MKKKKRKKNYYKYYKYIDIIKIFSLVMIFLYHINILRGGYLLVCTFFVISGYLSCLSLFKKDKVSFKEYYKNKILRLYLPLIMMCFITVGVIKLFFDITWFNLKPEVTSILLGYNNFWQISTNIDYFSRQIDSPFIHLWYVSILLQFDLVLPIIFTLLKKIGDKVNKIIPVITLIITSIIGTIYFYYSSINMSTMIVYYNTFTRIFPLFFGVSLSFIQHYYKNLIPDKLKNECAKNIIFFIYLIILLLLAIMIYPNSKYSALAMILVTLISFRIVDYASTMPKRKANLSLKDKFVKRLSSISYEFYLFQYPVIFLFQFCILNKYLNYILIFLVTLVLSIILHFINCYKNNKNKILIYLKYLLGIIVFGIVLYGIVEYFSAKDYTKDMNALKKQLEQNEMLIENSKEGYASKLKEEEENWNKTLESLNYDKNNLKDVVSSLPIVGIGDSVMLGAVNNLYNRFPNGYFDGKVSRTAWDVNDILIDLKNKNLLGDPVIFNLGTNGDCSWQCKKTIVETCGDREIFWINTVNLPNVNDTLNEFASYYSNLHIIDWYSTSKGHSEYFAYDGIHLTTTGRSVYTDLIYNSIYKIYEEKYIEKENSIINQHEEEIKNKFSFYGNDLLVNTFDYIKQNFTNANYTVNKKFNYENLKKDINKNIKNKTLNYNVVLLVDSSFNLNKKEYNSLIELFKDHNLYIISTNKNFNIKESTYDNVKIINIYNEIKSNNYFMADNRHLNKEGSEYLSNFLNEIINKKDIDN